MVSKLKVHKISGRIEVNQFALICLIPEAKFGSHPKSKRCKVHANILNYSCNFILPATLPKVALLHGCFSRFLNFTNGSKSRNVL